MQVLYFYFDSLNNNNINEIPDSLSNLSSLGDLSLKNNSIKEIPHSLRKLTSLTHLYLNNNEIEELPKFIKSMKIAVLELRGNLFNKN